MGYTGVRKETERKGSVFCHIDNYMLDEAVCFLQATLSSIFLTMYFYDMGDLR